MPLCRRSDRLFRIVTIGISPVFFSNYDSEYFTPNVTFKVLKSKELLFFVLLTIAKSSSVYSSVLNDPFKLNYRNKEITKRTCSANIFN